MPDKKEVLALWCELDGLLEGIESFNWTVPDADGGTTDCADVDAPRRARQVLGQLEVLILEPFLHASQEAAKFPYPNRLQWFVISIAYVWAFVKVQPWRDEEVLGFLVVGGLLLVWRFSRPVKFLSWLRNWWKRV